MDALNKFGKMVQKGVSNIKMKNPFEKDNKIERGLNSIQDQPSYLQTTMHKQIPSQQKPKENNNTITNTNEQQPEKKVNSLSAFLAAGKKNTVTNDSNNNAIPSSQTIKNDNKSQSNISSPQKSKTNGISEDFLKGFILIRGETPIQHERKCELRIEEKEFPCKSLITGYAIHFVPSFVNTKISYELIYPTEYFTIPIHMIQECDKSIDKKDSFKYILEIKTKDNRVIELLFRVGQNESFYYSLSGLVKANETSTYSAFAMLYNKDVQVEENGWDLYNAEKEYERQGLTNLPTETLKGLTLRRTLLNANYNLCESYPQFLIIPGQISDDEMRQAAAFRTKNRIPTLAYFYFENRATLWRSSQTKSGLKNNRNEYDEKLLSLISQNGSEKKITIFDARPYLSACANKLKGAGFENITNYAKAELIFCEIDNIHVARSALSKVYSCISSTKLNENRNFFTQFEQTRWPEFIFLLIKACINVATAIKKGSSALIHCSDGWDRASQLTAFSQLLIDPYFRTVRGYMILIEKDFLSFGHQFKYRNGYFAQQECNEDPNSPILLQWLDATHQMLVQFPMYFQFNMDFLVFIASNINTGKYGTFLYNHDKDRESNKAKTKTMSIWTDILLNEEKYINPYYDPKTQEQYFLTPQFSYHKIRFWEEYFMKYSQLNSSISYDHCITRDVSMKEERIMSNFQFFIQDKNKSCEDDKTTKNKMEQLKYCCAELIENGEIPIDNYNKIPKECQDMLKEIEEEVLDGKMELDQESNKMVFNRKQIPELNNNEEIKSIEENKIESNNNNGEMIAMEEKNIELNDNGTINPMTETIIKSNTNSDIISMEHNYIESYDNPDNKSITEGITNSNTNSDIKSIEQNYSESYDNA